MICSGAVTTVVKPRLRTDALISSSPTNVRVVPAATKPERNRNERMQVSSTTSGGEYKNSSFLGHALDTLPP